MKPNSKNTKELGFTLIELLVVIAILGMMSTLVIVNFNKQRAARSVVLSENEMVTNIRKAQSYMLSSVTLNSVPVKYYVITFNQNSSQYNISVIDKNNTWTQKETISLKDNAYISSVKTSNNKITPVCAQIAFASPFGKMYVYESNSVCDMSIISILNDPLPLDALANKTAALTISNAQTTNTKIVTALGISGRVEGN